MARESTPAASGSLRQGGIAVAIASNTANAFGLVLYLVLIRLLSKDDYGAVGALLALVLVGSVPGLALQIVLARRTATTEPGARGSLWTSLLYRAALISVGVGLLAAALAPVGAVVLHLDSVAPMLWLALALIPTTILFAFQGVLQGAERFTGMSTCLVLAAAGKLVGSTVGAAGGVTGVMFGTAIGMTLAAAGGFLLIAADLRPHWSGSRRAGGAPRFLSEMRHATSGMFGLLALQNADVVLARHLLDGDESGVYAAGALVARGAFWALHVVAVVVLPRLTDAGHRRRLLPRALGLVSGGGAVTVVGVLLTGPALLPLAFGDDYNALGATAAVFAVIGSLIALAELLLYADLAAQHHRIGWAMWGTVTVFVALVYLVGVRSVAGIAGFDAVPLSILVLGGAYWTLAGTRRHPVDVSVSPSAPPAGPGGEAETATTK